MIIYDRFMQRLLTTAATFGCRFWIWMMWFSFERWQNGFSFVYDFFCFERKAFMSHRHLETKLRVKKGRKNWFKMVIPTFSFLWFWLVTDCPTNRCDFQLINIIYDCRRLRRRRWVDQKFKTGKSWRHFKERERCTTITTATEIFLQQFMWEASWALF